MKIAGKRLKLADKVSFRPIGDEGVVLLIETGQLFSLNATGAAFVKLLGETPDADAAMAVLQAQFDVDKSTLASDLETLVEAMVARGILVFDT
ncbi:MAG: PqqD family protein [Pseudomonadota bacterium]